MLRKKGSELLTLTLFMLSSHYMVAQTTSVIDNVRYLATDLIDKPNRPFCTSI